MADKIKLLIVDDEVRFLDAIAKRLEMREFEVTKAANGVEALAAARADKFDVALLDLKMPGMNGQQVLEAIKAELPSARMREKVPLIGAGYVKPLYLQPFYQKRGHPCAFHCPRYSGEVSYERGLCPVTERMHFEELITHEFMRPGITQKDIDDVACGFEKVCSDVEGLRDRQGHPSG